MKQNTTVARNCVREVYEHRLALVNAGGPALITESCEHSVTHCAN